MGKEKICDLLEEENHLLRKETWKGREFIVIAKALENEAQYSYTKNRKHDFAEKKKNNSIKIQEDTLARLVFI